MNYLADWDIGRNTIRRVQVVEIDDDGTQQRAIVTSLAGEEMKMAYRGQYFGATGVPPKGADGFAILIGGRPDQAVFLGIEHKDHRVHPLDSGEKAIYDAHGNVIKLLGEGKDKIIHIKGAEKVTVEGAQEVTIKSDTKIVIEAADKIQIKGDIEHEGNITSTGQHIASAHV